MPKVLIDGQLVDVPAEALFSDDGTTPFAPSAPVTPPEGVFTAEDVARARAEAAAEAQGRLDEVNNRLAELTETVGSLTAAEQREQARLEEEQRRLEEERRQAEESNLDATELIRRREQEWQQQLADVETRFTSQLEQERQQREQAEALAEKEREFNNLRDYIANQVEANKDKIAPQLLTWIGGNSTEEVDAAVARAIETTDQIAAEMQEAFGQVQQPGVPTQVPVPVVQTPGTRPVSGPGNFDPAGQQTQQLTPEQIANMPMSQYAELRRNMGIGGQNNNRGLFG